MELELHGVDEGCAKAHCPEFGAVTVADGLLLKDMRRHTRVPHSGNSVNILHGVHG